MVDIIIEVNNEKIKRIPKMQNNNNYSNIIIITTSISYFLISNYFISKLNKKTFERLH